MTDVPRVTAARRRAGVLAVTAVLAVACSDSNKTVAQQTPTPSPPWSSSTSVSPSAAATSSVQQVASRAALAAYVGTQQDVFEVVNSTRSDTDPRLSRHAASTGVAELAKSVEAFVANHFALRGENRVVSWRQVTFYPPSGTPTAITATACVDSSGARVYDIRTGKEQTPLPGHLRTPVAVRAQVDHGLWKVVDAKPDYAKPC